MSTPIRPAAIWLGALLSLGLLGLGAILGNSLQRYREYERVVNVKGLAERDVPADLVVWPIRFSAAGDSLADVYAQLDSAAQRIVDYLHSKGLSDEEVRVDAPAITDKLAQQWGNAERVALRFTANQTITVRSPQVDLVRALMGDLAELGRTGIAFSGQEYPQTEYLFTRLNELKPAMVQEATQAAREVANKFAQDSGSQLGKIRSASQGQFSIEPRDSSTPHIKKVRVVSTVEYYLSD